MTTSSAILAKAAYVAWVGPQLAFCGWQALHCHRWGSH